MSQKTNFKEFTNKKRIIAESQGWVYKKPDSNGITWVVPPNGTPRKEHVPSAPFRPSDIPDYPTDLHAMRDVVLRLNEDDRLKYNNILKDLCAVSQRWSCSEEDHWSVAVNASAELRADAFIEFLKRGARAAK